jgi:DNA invertase Pin-like site-specific DNA recombinase
MLVRAYLRTSTKEQDGQQVKADLEACGHRMSMFNVATSGTRIKTNLSRYAKTFSAISKSLLKTVLIIKDFELDGYLPQLWRVEFLRRQ